MARHEILPEPLVFGKYRLLERIAAGRMGEIFKAKRSGVEGFEKVMVVKRLYPHLSSSEAFVSAFVNEARLTVSLSHANIVQVLDLGQNEGAYYMAMEHVAGFDLGTMRRILRATRKPFPLDIAVFVVSEVAKGLDYAHRRKDYNFESLNIVHRDLCPANVLVSFEGEVKLTDFGISSALSAVGTAQDDVRRRYLYASPEQARGEHLNHRSDIFSLGLILYELVSGIHPYDDPDPRQVQRRAVEGVIEPVRQLVDLPRALEQIINSSLVPELSQRVDSAGTLYEELISYLFASGHKADSRSLSQFMQELKRLEEELFQASQIPPEPELESSDLEDIELEEVESADLEAAPDLWGMAQPESGVAPKRVSGFISRVGHDQMVEAPGMATAAEIPTRRPAMTPRGQSERRFDAVAQPDAMPAGLSALADRLLGGQGAAVILEGALGHGPEYLPDRLAARLRARGLFSVLELVQRPHERAVPFRLAGELVRFCADAEPGARLSAQAQVADPAQVAALGARLAARGLSEAQRALALALCGQGVWPRQGIEARGAWVDALVDQLLCELPADRPLVVVLDGAEHLDARSQALLRALAQRAPYRPLLLILSSPDGADLAGLLGCPVERVAVAERGEAPALGRALSSLSPCARGALEALAAADAPLPISSLGASEADVQALREGGLVRCLLSEHLLPASVALAEALRGARGGDPARAVAARLLALAPQEAAARWSSPWWPSRLRWVALAAGAREAAALAARCGLWLEAEGAYEEAQALYEGLLGFLGEGAPGERAALRCALARLHRRALQVEAAEAALAGVEALAVAANDERIFWVARGEWAAVAALRRPEAPGWAALHLLLERARALGERPLWALSSLLLGRWHLEQGDLLEAQRALEAAAHAASREESQGALCADALCALVELRCLRGQHAAAEAELGRLAALEARGVEGARARLAQGRAWLALSRGQLEEAQGRAEEALSLSQEHGLAAASLEAALLAGRVAAARQDGARALSLGQHVEASAQARGLGGLARAGRELAGLGGVLCATGDKALDALRGLHAALSELDRRPVRAQIGAHARLAAALQQMGSGRDAEHHRAQAAALAQRIHGDPGCARLCV